MKQRWGDLSPTRRGMVLVLATVQIGLALAAWLDLRRRPADQVNGRKSFWAAAIGINFLGPIAYFTRGRRTSASASSDRTGSSA